MLLGFNIANRLLGKLVDIASKITNMNDIIFVIKMTVANQKTRSNLTKIRYKLGLHSSTFSNLV